MSDGKHRREDGRPIGNQDPNKRGRGGEPVTGQPKDDGKHSDTNKGKK